MTTNLIRKYSRRSLAAVLLASAIAVSPAVTPPAHAIFGFGDIVYDPANHAENILTAARTLQQINNQIQQLQNEAQVLINQARNLTSLPYSALAQLQSTFQRTQFLLSQAQRIAYDVAAIEDAFTDLYGTAAAAGDFDAMIANAEERWQTSVAGFEDALRVQAGVVGNIDDARAEMSALVTRSQSATGALQAGNQILALQSQQIADLTAAIAAQNRAQSLEAARAASAEAQARENLARFLDYGGGYAPTTVRLFGG